MPLTPGAEQIIKDRYVRKDPATGQPLETPADLIESVAQEATKTQQSYGGYLMDLYATANTAIGTR